MNVEKEAVSVLIVDDHQLVRDGLKSNLGSSDYISSVYEAETAQEAVFKAGKYHPDVVVMDINLPDLNGMEATRLILENNPQARVLGLSMHNQKEYVVGMMRAGAKGFLTKTCSSKELNDAIFKVFSDQTYLSNEVLGAVVEAAVNPQDNGHLADGELTRRESQILRLIADGKTNNEVSEILSISSRTVEKHRKTLMDKLDIRTVAQLTKYAIKHGLAFLD